MKFQVLRQHHGDKMYLPGDTREANESEVKHLLANGVLKPAHEKKEPAPANKAEGSAPKNKAAK